MRNNLEKWTTQKSSELYGVENWSSGYFHINEQGELAISPFEGKKNAAVSIPEIISGLKARGLELPVLLRIENLLDGQLAKLHASFASAIRELQYKGEYRGVFPIKVNQQQQVIKEMAAAGAPLKHGFEVGSKAELVIALSYLKNKKACLICNGYKDTDYIDLALYACKMGYNCILVLEMPSELNLILERSRHLTIRPQLGIRIKVSTHGGGHWAESAGDLSIFGLSTTDVIDALDILKQTEMLDCVRLVHFHLGSQLPNIRDIRTAVKEAARMYIELYKEGCQMGYLDLGGGLAVDYDGSHSNFPSSRNYGLDEYCLDTVEAIMYTLDQENIPHPHIVTESGRATVAYSSVLLFNVIDVSRLEDRKIPEKLSENEPESIHNLLEVYSSLTLKNLQECYNDAIFYRDEIRQLFRLGKCTLRQRSTCERIFWAIIKKIAEMTKELKTLPSALKDINLPLASIYYCNISIFQSLPDSWAIDHLFPIIPLHRLHEEPTERVILADITCDSDGKINNFIDTHGVKRVLEAHPIEEGKPYYMGAFLVGAYQETLGDLHNLFGDTNIVSVRINTDGTFDVIHEQQGDSVSDILSYVEYDPRYVFEQFRNAAEASIRETKITPQERFQIMQAYDRILQGYTYLNE